MVDVIPVAELFLPASRCLIFVVSLSPENLIDSEVNDNFHGHRDTSRNKTATVPTTAFLKPVIKF